MDRFSRNNYSNSAHLKELMTAPPMTAEQHAAINRKRNELRRMIEEAGVAATPGLDFGHHLPRKHLRIAYTTRSVRLLEAAERIRALGLNG